MAGFIVLQVSLEDIEENQNGDLGVEGSFPDGDTVKSLGGRWRARYSAPGYLDCTDWVIGSREQGPIAVARECFTTYGDDERGSDDARELAQVIRQARAQGYKNE